MSHINAKDEVFNKIEQILEDRSHVAITRALCNYFSTDELEEFAEFLEDEGFGYN